jgi:hypothetical protein
VNIGSRYEYVAAKSQQKGLYLIELKKYGDLYANKIIVLQIKGLPNFKTIINAPKIIFVLF